MNSAQTIFEDMMKLPDQETSVYGPSQTPRAKFFRKLTHGTPKGKRCYFRVNRPLFRDAVIVIDVPLSCSYKEAHEWISNLYKKYIVRVQPSKWEYIWHWDDYVFQRYGVYNYLESARNEKNKIELDSYYKFNGRYIGKPSFLFGWIKKKVGANKNPLNLIERKTKFTIGPRHYLVEKLTKGSTIVDIRLLNPQEGEQVGYTMKMEHFIDKWKHGGLLIRLDKFEKNPELLCSNF